MRARNLLVAIAVASGALAAATVARADGWGERWHGDGGGWREHGWGDGRWGYPPPMVAYGAPPGYAMPYGPPPVVPYGMAPYGYGYRYGGDDD